jgi:hypothetical protein
LRLSIREARIRARKLVTSKLESEARVELPDTYADARELVTEAMREFGEEAAAAQVPTSCPYSFEQLLDRNWLPKGPGNEAAG